MKISRAAVLRLSAVLAALLAAVLVPSILSGSQKASPKVQAQNFAYAPGPEESESLASLEGYWHDRLTYPTGRFDQRWLLKAAREDKLVRTAFPARVSRSKTAADSNSRLALTATTATFLGPQPQESDLATCQALCFSFGRVGGRVNSIALDPTTTTPGSMTAYFGSDGGGVWKSTNCCDAATTWAPTTELPIISTTSIDDIVVDPTNRWVYAATGDISFGSFAFGSSGILRSKDQGATWEVLGQSVFTPSYSDPQYAPVPAPDTFPQYQAVTKVRVDPNNSAKIIAGTKTGLYFSYDSGASWTGPCYTNSFITQRQDITDMITVDAGSTTTLLAAVGARGFPTTVQPNLGKNGANGIYSTTVPASGCPASWTAQTTGWPAGTASGVPCDPPVGTLTACPPGTNRLGRIEMAIAPSTATDVDPAAVTIYAEVQAVDAHGPLAIPATATPCGVLQRLPAVSSPGTARGCFFGLFRTTNTGTAWTQQADEADLYNLATTGPCGEDTPQNWYNQGLAVDPTDPDVLFMDTIDIYKSTNAGVALTDVSCGYYTGLVTNNVHVDNHVLVYGPPTGVCPACVANTLLAGNDGGIYVSSTATNNPVITVGGVDPGATISGQPVFTQMNNTVGTIEFYSGDISANFGTAASVFAVAGAQDNGSSTARWSNPPGPGAATTAWIQRIGGDGMFARLEPLQANDLQRRVYMESQNGNLRVSTMGEEGVYSGTTVVTWPWNSDTRSFVFPYEIDKHQCKTFAGVPETLCNHLIAGSNKVYETITGGVNPADWHANSPVLTKGTLGDRSFINQLAYAHSDNTVAIAGTNDGNVWYGFGMGQAGTNSATWVNVTNGNAVLPNRPILDVAIHPADPLVGYAAVGGFDENTPQDGHVFQVSCDPPGSAPVTCLSGSFSWVNKTGNLPNIPVDSIISNPLYPNQVFAGTDWGLYLTNNITAAVPFWKRFGGGLPNVMVWDMAIDRGDTTLALFTRGRGAWAALLSPSAPTAATVTTFTGRALGRRKGVKLSWRTASETAALGYNVWRFANGKGVKVNPSLIAAKGKGAGGAAYSLVDRNTRPGAVYTYRLQVVGKNGKRSFHAGTVIRVRR